MTLASATRTDPAHVASGTAAALVRVPGSGTDQPSYVTFRVWANPGKRWDQKGWRDVTTAVAGHGTAVGDGVYAYQGGDMPYRLLLSTNQFPGTFLAFCPGGAAPGPAGETVASSRITTRQCEGNQGALGLDLGNGITKDQFGADGGTVPEGVAVPTDSNTQSPAWTQGGVPGDFAGDWSTPDAAGDTFPPSAARDVKGLDRYQLLAWGAKGSMLVIAYMGTDLAKLYREASAWGVASDGTWSSTPYGKDATLGTLGQPPATSGIWGVDTVTITYCWKPWLKKSTC
jgi:hypothetical protein